jgi:hypothetical protein
VRPSSSVLQPVACSLQPEKSTAAGKLLRRKLPRGSSCPRGFLFVFPAAVRTLFTVRVVLRLVASATSPYRVVQLLRREGEDGEFRGPDSGGARLCPGGRPSPMGSRSGRRAARDGRVAARHVLAVRRKAGDHERAADGREDRQVYEEETLPRHETLLSLPGSRKSERRVQADPQAGWARTRCAVFRGSSGDPLSRSAASLLGGSRRESPFPRGRAIGPSDQCWFAFYKLHMTRQGKNPVFLISMVDREPPALHVVAPSMGRPPARLLRDFLSEINRPRAGSRR